MVISPYAMRQWLLLLTRTKRHCCVYSSNLITLTTKTLLKHYYLTTLSIQIDYKILARTA